MTDSDGAHPQAMEKTRRRVATPRAAWLLAAVSLAWLPASGHAQGSPAARPETTLVRSPERASSVPVLECRICPQRAPLPARLEVPQSAVRPAAIPAAATYVRTVPEPRTPTRRRRHGIGRTYRFAHGRLLDLDLTPSPEHCAPQVALRF